MGMWYKYRGKASMFDVGTCGRRCARLVQCVILRCTFFLEQVLLHRSSQLPGSPITSGKQRALGNNPRALHVLRACAVFWIWAAAATCWHADVMAPTNTMAIVWATPRRSQLLPAIIACWNLPGASCQAAQGDRTNKELAVAQMKPPSLNAALLVVCRSLEALAQLSRRMKDGVSGGEDARQLVKVLLGNDLEGELVRAAYTANSEAAFEPRVKAIEALESVADGAGSREYISQSLQIAQASLLDFIAAMPRPDARRAEEAIELESTGSASAFPWRTRAQ